MFQLDARLDAVAGVLKGSSVRGLREVPEVDPDDVGAEENHSVRRQLIQGERKEQG